MMLNLMIILLVICLIFKVLQKNSNIIVHPLGIFASIWVVVLFCAKSISTFNISGDCIFSFISIVLSAIISIFICSFIKLNKNNSQYILFDNFLLSNYNNLYFTLILCIFFRLLQIIYDIYIITKLGASYLTVFGNSESLRQLYLYYSSNQMNLLAKIVSNILNYFAEFGIVLSVLVSKYNKRYIYLYLTLLLALLHSILTMSKMSFFVDICFVISCFIVLINLDRTRHEQVINKKEIFKLISISTLFVIFLLILVSIQRGYSEYNNILDQVSIAYYKAISYLITPTLAFLKILDTDITFSWGTKTFNVFLKLFGYEFETFGAINVGIEDSTVYTMSGMFYADYGVVGSILLTSIIIFIISYVFYLTINKFTISKLAIFVSMNTALIMSFFTWMGRITFFWLFPIFIIVYSEIFFKE